MYVNNYLQKYIKKNLFKYVFLNILITEKTQIGLAFGRVGSVTQSRVISSCSRRSFEFKHVCPYMCLPSSHMLFCFCACNGYFARILMIIIRFPCRTCKHFTPMHTFELLPLALAYTKSHQTW